MLSFQYLNLFIYVCLWDTDGLLYFQGNIIFQCNHAMMRRNESWIKQKMWSMNLILIWATVADGEDIWESELSVNTEADTSAGAWACTFHV